VSLRHPCEVGSSSHSRTHVAVEGKGWMTFIDSGLGAIYQETLLDLLRRRFASLLTLLRGGHGGSVEAKLSDRALRGSL
jgi:hypothetical protein